VPHRCVLPPIEKKQGRKKMDYQLMEVADGKPVKMWTEGVAIDDFARDQLTYTAKLPFIFKHLAVMPDVHAG
jgi:tRNA-splicing ligase RtcB (3'-phosphate/5'-hydroxy nucleic acid ligase)